MDSKKIRDGRCISVNKSSWSVESNNDVYNAIINNSYVSKELPTVGDNVTIEIDEKYKSCVIKELLPRKTLLARKSNGKTQVLAANVDIVFIVTSLNDNFNMARLERLALLGIKSGAKVGFILTKSDLCSDEEKKYYLDTIKNRFTNYSTFLTSSVLNEGIEEIKSIWMPNETAVFIGSSGVGKSTIINRLMGEELIKTQSIREKDSRGRHTTTSRNLFVLPDKRVVIDEPGIRGVGLINTNDALDYLFETIRELETKCKYTTCTHVNNEGCAVLQAIEDGLITREEYDRYLKLKQKEKRKSIKLQEEEVKGYQSEKNLRLMKKNGRRGYNL